MQKSILIVRLKFDHAHCKYKNQSCHKHVKIMFYLDVGKSTTPLVFGPSKIIIIIMTIIFNNSSVLPSLDTYLSFMSLHNYLKEDNA